jgi:hypothetical protein
MDEWIEVSIRRLPSPSGDTEIDALIDNTKLLFEQLKDGDPETNFEMMRTGMDRLMEWLRTEFTDPEKIEARKKRDAERAEKGEKTGFWDSITEAMQSPKVQMKLRELLLQLEKMGDEVVEAGQEGPSPEFEILGGPRGPVVTTDPNLVDQALAKGFAVRLTEIEDAPDDGSELLL